MNNLFNNVYKNKKVFITGHTGFKGSWLAFWLVQLGAKVTGFSKDVPTIPSLFKLLKLESEIDHLVGDVRDHRTLQEALRILQPDFVFHLAAQPIVRYSYDHPTETITTNIIGTNNILDVLRIAVEKCIAVIVTSDKCYDNLDILRGYNENDKLGGKDPYSVSKGAAELVAKGYYHSFFKDQELIRIATARAGNVIGGGDWGDNRLIPDYIRSWKKDQKVKLRNPQSTRPWQHVLDLLSGYLRLGQQLSLNHGLNGESFNFGPCYEDDHTVIELITQIDKHYYKTRKIPFEIGDHSSKYEANLLKLDCTKAEKYLDWKACLNFEETLFYTAKWYSCYENGDSPVLLTKRQIESICIHARKLGRKWTL